MTCSAWPRTSTTRSPNRVDLPGASIKAGPDFRRIVAQPLRDWRVAYPEGVSLLSGWLRVPGSGAKLRPIQAAALIEAHDYRGLFGAIRVGGGKTLISLLAPVVLGARRPLLLVPAKLREKTKREARIYARSWHVARNLRILSYEMLSQVSTANFLAEYRPDLFILDECHKVKDTRRARARRIKRFYKQEKEHVPMIAMTGTHTIHTLRDYWHILRWCCPGLSPLPNDLDEFTKWTEALDEKVTWRRHPGVLVDLHPEAEGSSLAERARDAYARRFAGTPGVISSGEDVPPVGLIVRTVETPINRDELEPAILRLRERWETPDGHPFENAIDLWRHACEIVCGFYYVWDPRPPREWLDTRREWSQFCRHVLATNRRGLDTDKQVIQAIDRGTIADGGTLAAWRAIRDTFKPNTVPRWVDDSVIKYCAQWLEDSGGICWIEHRAFGEKLAAYSGVPFFYDSSKKDLDAHSGPVILSRRAYGEGQNLQRWSRALFPALPPNGKDAEQTIGRMHRDGQMAEDVEIDVIMNTIEQYREFAKCLSGARYIQSTSGQPQKLLYATLDIPSMEEIENRGRTDRLWQ